MPNLPGMGMAQTGIGNLFMRPQMMAAMMMPPMGQGPMFAQSAVTYESEEEATKSELPQVVTEDDLEDDD